MTLDEAKERIQNAGYTITNEERNGNDNGWRLVLESGQIVNVYDTGSFYVQGKNPEPIKTLLGDGGAVGVGRKVFVV